MSEPLDAGPRRPVEYFCFLLAATGFLVAVAGTIVSSAVFALLGACLLLVGVAGLG